MRTLTLLTVAALLIAPASAAPVPESSVAVPDSMNTEYLLSTLGVNVAQFPGKVRKDGGRLYVRGVTQQALSSAVSAYTRAAADAWANGKATQKLHTFDDVTAKDLAQALVRAGVLTQAQLVTALRQAKGL